ncbi:uncharacterized protein N7496_009321 [Penicillium cataractarum]|uniref:Uncharacterized protein n=1 Tax=Penicillium cataractarum TaxID=2100454 RepID=A0A9W9UZT6_9EURO|nr:uncharacterized protein N7496_009321 [Penicillium cataractarum]KAJ5363608.1 hypothetical protein N7496_009321 [Penicillium cataractarum]
MTMTIDSRPDYPVQPKPYIPMLIRFFQDLMGLAALQVDMKSPAYFLRSSFISNALTDPCLFHSTLYLASAHLDTMRGTHNNQITLYHHTKTVRLLNTRIASGDVVDDGTIASVLLLLMSGTVEKESGAAEAHREALLRMVDMRGGFDKLGFDGVLSEMIQMKLVHPAVIFDLADAFPAQWACTPVAPTELVRLVLDRLGAYTTGNPSVKSYLMRMFEHVLELLEAVSDDVDEQTGLPRQRNVSVEDMLDRTRPWMETILLDHSPQDFSRSEWAMLRSCLASVTIVQSLLDYRLPFQMEMIMELLKEMKSDLAVAEPIVWVRHSPEANLWVAVVGMAMAPEVDGRLWFLMNEKCVVSSIQCTAGRLHEKSWYCFRLLRSFAKAQYEKYGHDPSLIYE